VLSDAADEPQDPGHGIGYEDEGLYADQSELDRLLDENLRLREELQQVLERESAQETLITNLRRGIRELVERQDGQGPNDKPTSLAQSSGPTSSLPKIRTTLNARSPITSTRPFSPSATKPIPSPSQKSPTRQPVPHRPLYQSSSSPSKARVWPQASSHQAHFMGFHTSSSPELSIGLQSFGPFCEAFIEENTLSDRLHQQLRDLFDGTLSSKWKPTIRGWFGGYDEETASRLADGLFRAMCQDIKGNDEY
jgi:hypothetical protein